MGTSMWIPRSGNLLNRLSRNSYVEFNGETRSAIPSLGTTSESHIPRIEVFFAATARDPSLGPPRWLHSADDSHPDRHFIDSSNSRIQFFDFRTSRGLDPSAGPTIPSFSIMSIRRAARP